MSATQQFQPLAFESLGGCTKGRDDGRGVWDFFRTLALDKARAVTGLREDTSEADKRRVLQRRDLILRGWQAALSVALALGRARLITDLLRACSRAEQERQRQRHRLGSALGGGGSAGRRGGSTGANGEGQQGLHGQVREAGTDGRGDIGGGDGSGERQGRLGTGGGSGGDTGGGGGGSGGDGGGVDEAGERVAWEWGCGEDGAALGELHLASGRRELAGWRGGRRALSGV